MLSFRNANPGDLDVNQLSGVSEKWGFIHKLEGLRKSGIYTKSGSLGKSGQSEPVLTIFC